MHKPGCPWGEPAYAALSAPDLKPRILTKPSLPTPTGRVQYLPLCAEHCAALPFTEYRRFDVPYCCPSCRTWCRPAPSARVAQQLCAGSPIGEPCHDSWSSLRVRGRRVEGEVGRRSESGRSGRGDSSKRDQLPGCAAHCHRLTRPSHPGCRRSRAGQFDARKWGAGHRYEWGIRSHGGRFR